MKAGLLRDRVTIEQEGRVSNGQGGWKTGWMALAERIPARIEPLSGDEALRLGIERSTSQYRVSVRRRTDLKASHRLLWKSHVLAIKSLLPHPQYPQTHQLMICEMGQGS